MRINAKPIGTHQMPKNKKGAMKVHPFNFKICLAWVLAPLLCLIFLCSATCAVAPTTYYAGQTYKFTTGFNPDLFDFDWAAVCCSDEDCCNDPTCCIDSNCGSNTGTNTDPFIWTAPDVKCPTEVTISVVVSNEALSSCKGMKEIKITVLPLAGITVIKDAIPEDPQDFDFKGSGTIGEFTLDDDGETDGTYSNSKTFGDLIPATYSIEEIVPSGWTLTSAVCSDGSTIDAIDLEPGKRVTVTFTNTKKGSIIVDKVTSPAGDPQEFDFTTNYGKPFKLSDTSDPNDSGPLEPGTYSVAEIPVPCWDTQITCGVDCDPSAIQLGPSETVYVTAKNTRSPPIIKIAAPPVLTCTVTSAKLDATVEPEGSYTYSWRNSDDLEIATTEDTAVSSPGTYILTVTSENGCTVKETVAVSYRECEPAVGSISGIKFNDLNNNEERDANEPGLSGWTINLMQDNLPVKSATTSSNSLGSYSIDSILPGTYTLEEGPSPSSGWTQTYPVGNIYTVVVSETGLVTVTKSDQNVVPSTEADFGNKFKQSPEPESPLKITKTAQAVTLIPNMQTTFTIIVENIGEIEIHDIKIVDELSPMLEFIPPAKYGDTVIQHDIIGGNLILDLTPIGSLEPGRSWTITYNVKLRPEACNKASSITTLPPIITDGETILSVMAAESDPANILQMIDALSRNKTKLEAKLESIKNQRDTFYKAGATLKSGTKTIAETNYTLNNYTNISTGETLQEQLNATGFLVFSEYSRPAKYDLLATTYGMKGEAQSDFYNFFPTKETLKIEYDKPEKGCRTYTVRYYATGDTLIMTVDPYGNVVDKQYRKTPGVIEPNYLTNCATAFGKVGEQDEDVESNRACVDVEWSCVSPQPMTGIRVFKEADREVANVGDTIKYKYVVENTGSLELTSLTLNDDKLGIVVLNEPGPLAPGQSLTFYAYNTVKAGDGPILKNVVVATAFDPDGNEVTSDPAWEEVKIVMDCLTKTASPKVVKPGDYVSYNITWYVSGDKIVDDYPNGVSFVSASPEPINEAKNTWNIDPKKDSGTITIIVQVAQDIGNTSFSMGQGVTGTGFVNVHNDIRTNPVILSNKATLFRENKPICTAFADINIGPPQTYAALKEHGSGTYASEEVIKYRNSNRSIEWNKSLTATYKPTTFSLPNNRDIDYQTKWIEKAKSRNYATGASTNEEYTYANRINRDSSLKLDENGSTMITETDFEGVGHIGLLKKDANANRTWNASQIFESQEDYVGSFKINEKFDEYGKNVEYEKSVSGIGYVAGDRNIGNSQKSYESGTGKYQSEERISTVVNYIVKDINLTHLPASYSYTPTFSTSSDLLWNEGMWSKTPTSLISERFSSAQSLDLQSTARGLNDMETEASVIGKADFRTLYKDKYPDSENEVDRDDQYIGKFEIRRKTILAGVAKYDRPHVSLSKEARVDLINSTFADYRITIENNGNRALGPVYVKDVFPIGTEYVTSSLRPTELTTSYANWTLLSMSIGSKVTIDLRLNITEEPSNLVNRVEAAGKYDESWTLARNFSVVRLNWLTCCPPQISASKTAKVDALDQRVVWYSLNLKNREKYTMVAFLIDQLPGSMQLLNSSLEPSENRSNLITWTILDLAPGESRTITYRARAEKDGIYVNVAHIEAFSVDGPDGAAADVEARINLGEGGALTSAISSDWQPPTCFGLNCSGQIYSNDWVPCYTCGTGEPGNAVVLPPCASCISTGDDNLP